MSDKSTFSIEEAFADQYDEPAPAFDGEVPSMDDSGVSPEDIPGVGGETTSVDDLVGVGGMGGGDDPVDDIPGVGGDGFGGAPMMGGFGMSDAGYGGSDGGGQRSVAVAELAGDGAARPRVASSPSPTQRRALQPPEAVECLTVPRATARAAPTPRKSNVKCGPSSIPSGTASAAPGARTRSN